MSGDSKIGIVGGIVRTVPVRNLAAHIATPSQTSPRARTADAPPSAGLIRLAAELASQPAPIDSARVMALRGAIAEGRYTPAPAKIAEAMIEHLRGSVD